MRDNKVSIKYGDEDGDFVDELTVNFYVLKTASVLQILTWMAFQIYSFPFVMRCIFFSEKQTET